MNTTGRLQSRLAFALMSLIVAGGIAGCGGGGGGGGTYFPIPTVATTPPPAPEEPPVMQSSYDKFIDYLKGVVATTLDTAEPADVTAFDPPPVSDTLEPVAVQ